MILPNSLLPTKSKGFTLIRRRVKANSLGFTLIELLVVIAIISILMSLGFAGFQRAQINARDAKRIQAMDQVKIALELYFDTNLSYPASSGGKIDCGGGPITWDRPFVCSGQVYMKTLPEDPSGTTQYCYVATGTPLNTYSIYAQMENDVNGNYGPGIPPGCTVSYDYSVENIK